MYKIYFKQAVQMLRQHKFLSMVAVSGTALAIMMIMAILVSEEVKNISVAPEINRNRTYYISFETTRDSIRRSMNSGFLSYNMLRQYLSELKVPEYVSAVNSYYSATLNPTLTGREGTGDYLNTIVRRTNAAYWKILSFSFLEGRPFSPEEFESGVPVAVVSQSTARQLFRGEQAIGQDILVGFEPYRIIGIVRDVSPVFTTAHGDVWVPYTSQKVVANMFHLMLQAGSTGDYPAMYEEIREVERKYQAENPPKTLYLRGPENHRIYRMDLFANDADSMRKAVQTQNRKTGFILLVLLLIPAVNLSGFSLSRIRQRTAEIGVRKAFGAKRYVILFQILCENLVTSLAGGVIGLLLSYATVFRMRDWLLNIEDDSMIPAGTLLSPSVFLSVFAVCLLINLLSAGIPAYRASRMKIIDSLNQNDKQA